MDDEIIAEIVRRLLRKTTPKRIILFGSAATHKISKKSDIDLLIIEPSSSNTRETSVRLREALRGMGYAFDVIVMDSDRFDESKEVIGGIAYPANKYGRVIYEAA